MNEQKNNINKTLLTVVIVLLVLVLSLGGYLIYDKVISDKMDNTSSNPTDNNGTIIENNSMNVINGNKEVTYDYEKESEDDEFYILKSLTVNGIDVSKYVSSEYYNSINIDKQNDFVIINYSNGGTCGFDEWDLLIFDYNGQLLYQDKEYENNLDKLVYDGIYSYSDNSLVINYHLSCDMDCNTCSKLLYENGTDGKEASCTTINNYKTINSKAKYKLTYLGNGKFSSEEVVENTSIVNDDLYSSVFNKCK